MQTLHKNGAGNFLVERIGLSVDWEYLVPTRILRLGYRLVGIAREDLTTFFPLGEDIRD